MQGRESFIFTIPPLSDDEFNAIRRLVYKKSGIYLTEEKRDLVRSRLGKILRRRGIPSFREYYRMVINDESGKMLVELLDAISTNFTYLFREKEHFEFLKNVVIPQCVPKNG